MSDVIVVLDLGSFEGFSTIWDQLQDRVELIGVDPFEEAGIRIGKFNRKEITFRTIVGDKDEENVPFHIAANKHASSLLIENTKLVSRFHAGDYGKIVATETVSVKEMKKLLTDQNIHKFDFLKIDLEGYELVVMKNLEDILRHSCVGIEIECFFQMYHTNRPLFSEIELYLRSLGYSVFDIRLEKWGRKNNPIAYPVDHHGNVRGGNAQVMFANVLFFKDPLLDQSMPVDQVKKLIELAKLFNEQDFADELRTHFAL